MKAQNYMMCSAAVPTEAYNGEMADLDPSNVMVNVNWREYHPKTWAANWHMLFSADISRKALTWRDRFADISEDCANIWQFYSSGDEVFELTHNPYLLAGVGFDWSKGADFNRYSWQKQETHKGEDSLLGGTVEAGWGFRKIPYTAPGMSYGLKPIPATTANKLSDDTLRTTPVFVNNPEYLTAPRSLTQAEINEMLGMGIPALSPSMGATRLIGIVAGTQVDIEQYRANPWVYHRGDYAGRWLHNDIRDAAYFFTYQLFDSLAANGDMK